MLTEKEKNLLKCLCEMYITVAYVAKSSSAKYGDAIRIKMFNDKYTLVVQTIEERLENYSNEKTYLRKIHDLIYITFFNENNERETVIQNFFPNNFFGNENIKNFPYRSLNQNKKYTWKRIKEEMEKKEK